MKNLRNVCMTAAFCALGAMAVPQTAQASSHREAPAISRDPVADNTDLWAWVKAGTHDTLYIVAAYNPLEEPSGGPNFHTFSDEVLYEIHIARGPTSLQDVVTYQIQFKTQTPATVSPSDLNASAGGGKEFFLQLAAGAGGGFPVQTYTVTKVEAGKTPVVIAQDVKVAPPNVGARTFSIVSSKQFPTTETSYNDAFAASFASPLGAAGSEGTVWAGPRDDGFYVDLGGVFDLAGLRAKGNAQDGVAGFNCHAIALEIPTTKLTANGQAPGNTPGDATTLGVWASASRRKVTILRNNGQSDGFGPWVQVSRLGLPLVNEALIGLQDKDKYNRTHPSKDLDNFGAYFLNPILVRDAEFAGFYANGGPLQGITPPKSGRMDIVEAINIKNFPAAGAHGIQTIGDVLRVDMAMDPGFPNGRPIPGGGAPNKEQADVTDVLLSLILTKQLSGVSDGVDYNDRNYLTTTPWLALPWSGDKEGHGRTTP
ncbi:DUF4331 domain-containing protein [Hyalangium versicolor]|uniref:DUF4331 domain-containing protein n=1 Tax=Hyalangium versicolor TaxID=2861190 RepID=UPI001CCDF103|nr:DUF4331 domain-containing protein [Hyalangium versicolor]